MNYENENNSNGVSRRAFLTTLIFGIILAAIIGAVVATFAYRINDSKGYKNLNDASLEKVTGSKLTISEIVEANKNSVVEINTSMQSHSLFGTINSEGAGSGVIVNKDGYIATNHHVIDGATSINVRLHDGSTYPAELIGSDERNDIAVLKIDAKNLKAVTIGKSKELSVGDLAVAIGNPLGKLGGTATQGIISALDRKIQVEGMSLSLLQTDAAINPGNSGGGLFNSKGELIGIVDSKASGIGVEGLGFALPIDKVGKIIDDLIEHGHVTGRPAVGISIFDISDEEIDKAGVDSGGVYIKDVIGSNAKKSGLKSGDKIVGLDGEEITSANTFIMKIQEHKVGDTVKIKVKRNNKDLVASVKLEDSNEINN